MSQLTLKKGKEKTKALKFGTLWSKKYSVVGISVKLEHRADNQPLCSGKRYQKDAWHRMLSHPWQCTSALCCMKAEPDRWIFLKQTCTLIPIFQCLNSPHDRRTSIFFFYILCIQWIAASFLWRVVYGLMSKWGNQRKTCLSLWRKPTKQANNPHPALLLQKYMFTVKKHASCTSDGMPWHSSDLLCRYISKLHFMLE